MHDLYAIQFHRSHGLRCRYGQSSRLRVTIMSRNPRKRDAERSNSGGASSSTPAHLVVLIHGLWGLSASIQASITDSPGSPPDLAVAKQTLAETWAARQPTQEPRREMMRTRDAVNVIEVDQPGSDEELVVIIAGGMTSKLTYDGIDVCASRVVWEVGQNRGGLLRLIIR